MGGNYSMAQRSFRGLTQGSPLSSTIFNKFVDIVVHNWVSMVVGYTGGQDRLGREEIHRDTFFYMLYGLVASTDPEWLQGAFETLIGLLYKVRLRINASKKVGILCCPCLAVRTQ